MTVQARVQSSLVITDTVGNFNYNTPSQRGNFVYDLTTSTLNGPTPGAIVVPTNGIDIDMSQLTIPGLAEIYNLDLTNYIEYGLRYLGAFFTWGEVGPGEYYLWKFSRHVTIESGTGVGTAAVDTGIAIHLRADTASCRVVVNVFDK